MIRINWVELGGNATNVEQYVLRSSGAIVHNGSLCQMASASSEGNAP